MYPGAVELRLLRYVVVVAEELNFTRAAERLNTSQPSLSRQISKLEQDIGVELFRRTRRWVEPTPAGLRFVAEARRALVHAERAVLLAQQIKEDRRESYTVGYCAFIDVRFLATLRRMKPIGSAHFILRNAVYAEIVDKLMAHEWEAALMVLPVREAELVSEPLMREPLAAALPVSHPLSRKREVELSDLRGEPVVLAPKCFGPGFRDFLLTPLEKAGIHPARHEAASAHEALHLVAEGFGITLGQQSVMSSAKEQVSICRIKGIPREVETGIVYHKDNDSPLLKKYLEAVRHTRDRYVAERGRELPISA
jgi:DNA-binding transcriptional LysR family regulator